jgi:hypothetical protein
MGVYTLGMDVEEWSMGEDDARPAKGWSQPQPGKLGPAVTPDNLPVTRDDLKSLQRHNVLAGVAGAILGTVMIIGVKRIFSRKRQRVFIHGDFAKKHFHDLWKKYRK